MHTVQLAELTQCTSQLFSYIWCLQSSKNT